LKPLQKSGVDELLHDVVSVAVLEMSVPVLVRVLAVLASERSLH
jgi:hypothetical protein